MNSGFLKTMMALGLALATAGHPEAVRAEEAGGGQAAAAAPAKKVDGRSSFVTADSTKIDFTDTMIDGKMQAPQGFFLQGRQSQAMTQMVRLRSKFRGELRNSKSAVKSLVK